MRGTEKWSGREAWRSRVVCALLCIGGVFAGGCAGLVTGNSTAQSSGNTLTITGVAAANATSSSVAISWQTSVAANSQVEYGPSTAYGQTTTLDPGLVTAHQEAITSLKAGTGYHFRVHSTDASGNSAVSGDFQFTTQSTAGPSVAVTSPTQGATVSGTITLIASASDSAGIASVQFSVDGAAVGSPISAAPYSYSLDTTKLANASHTISATATDTVGNTATSAAVSVHVNNAVPAPTIASLNPASGLVGTTVTISGANFGATQGSSTITFGGIPATATSWSATSIVTSVPTGATTGLVIVTVGGASSSGVTFTVTTPAPTISSLSPTSGVVGTAVTISGANFGATQGSSTVSFNGTSATATSWSASTIVAAVPAGATSGNVVVTVSGVASNGMSFTVTTPAPSISGLNPSSGAVGSSVTISGANFGASQGSSTVKFNGTAAAATSWSASSIIATVPTGATSGSVVVAVGGQTSNGVSFTVNTSTPGPSITSLSPASGVIGTSIIIAGANFGATQGSSTVKFNGTTATATSWSATSIVTAVPTGATSGGVVVTVNGVASNGASFTVTVPAPSISSLSPTSGVVGTSVTIAGANFGATEGSSTVKFNGTTATATSWSATSIVTAVPTGATSGSVVVTVNGVASNGASFTVTVPAPSISSLSPTSGVVGTAVTISGANFGATEGSSTVKFNGTTATATSWSATSIVTAVPTGATSGNVIVTVGGQASNGVSFTVSTPAPTISSLSPTSGAVGTSVTIAGANFGATQGSSVVSFNGTTATATSWSATSIVTAVPTGATSGNVIVTVGGQASNGVSFTVATPAPTISSLSPTSGAVGTSVTIAGANFGATQGSSTVSFNGTAATVTSWSATSIVTAVPTGATTGNVVVTASGQASNGVSFTVSSGTSTMGPLAKSGTNSHYFVNPAGQAVFLSGSHTWNDFQDLGNGGGTVAGDFTAYVSMLSADGQNVTALWRKDLPQYCGWAAGGVWLIDTSTGMPWVRSSTAGASDGGNKFDLSTFNQAYFTRLRARVIQLQQSGVYAIVQLFDGLQTTGNRCGTTAPTGDGYPFTGINNINGVDDGYVSGTSGTNSYTMTTNNAISNYQDAYVKEVINTLNDLPNVIWEISEEAPTGSANWWAPHMIGLIHAYEGGGTFEGQTYTAQPYQHPVGWPTTQYPGNDSQLYGSTADWIAPTLTAAFPAVVSTNNQGKVVLNDSDHALSYTQFLNSNGTVMNQPLRGYAWENFTSGAGGVLFMDPYEIYWTSSLRNSCTPTNPANDICTGVDTKYEPFRSTLGYMVSFAGTLDLVKTTPQGGLSSTGYCLAQTPAVGAEYLVYAPNGGSFTVNLSATTRTLNVEWLNPATGATSAGGTVTGGATNQSFTAPFSGDAVLYLVDAAGHN